MAAALVALLGLGGAALATTPAVADEAGGVSVEITDLLPAVALPDDELVIRGTVENTADSVLEDPTVSLRVQWRTPNWRTALELWLDPEGGVASRNVVTQPLDGDLAPGDRVPFEIRIPVEEAGVAATESSWGARGLEVRAGDATRSASDRTVGVFYPDTDPLPAPTELSVLLPLAPDASEWEAARAEERPVGDVAAERLTELAGLGGPDVSWALDPSVLASDPLPAEPDDDPTAPATDGTGGTTDPPSGTEAPTDGGADDDGAAADGADAVADLTRTLRTASAGRDVVALPYGDADSGNVIRAGQPSLLAQARERGAGLTDEADLRVLADVAWPAGGELDQQVADGLADAGYDTLVMPSSLVAPTTPITYTPTGRASLPASDGTTLDAALWDPELSTALGGAGTDELTSRQLLLGLTAVIARERPLDARGLLAVVDREAMADADLDALAERLEALEQAPWLDVVPLRSLLGRPDEALDRAALPAEGDPLDDGTELTLARTAAELTRADGVATALADPEPVLRGVRDDLLSVSSTAWRGRPEGRLATLEDATAALDDVLSGIGVTPPGSHINLIAQEGSIPIDVTNALDQEVTVTVVLSSSDPVLVVEDTPQLTLPPADGGTPSVTTVRVPVHGVKNGDVDVQVELRTPSGTVVGEEASFAIRVRADWETVGTAVVAGILGLLLVIGLYRTIRRGPRKATGEPS
ncbi:conserved hypothetical protein [Beutenbergia cavernae DSM 12333]|uniref:Secreted protein n=1 Tax=Beutenbergia cavernae (strain ATCC BAA-8 / DSM 12333 / CCUG 43141 / JCM 11478 / NBRC 16432 / NCIMB 13614 / HKI 0122) TaxID=471853 RepID=C5C6M3_BEUC1|nr:DUF6049 family protein [Beutenbergia cavernae]ACQ82447.1 conserved hypothetical protein [Beutenbergia cavernae DSM 12333]